MRRFISFIILFHCMSTLHLGYRTFAVHHDKSLFPVFFKVSIEHLFVNLPSGKIKYCFEKVLNFRSKKLYERCKPRQVPAFWPFINPLSPNIISHTNSPNWSLYIFVKNKLREFDNRSRHFLCGDHFINSHNLISWQCMDIMRRKLMLITIGT